MVNFSYEYVYSFTAWRDFSFNAQNCRLRDCAMTMTRQSIKDDTTEDPIIIVTALSHHRYHTIAVSLSYHCYRIIPIVPPQRANARRAIAPLSSHHLNRAIAPSLHCHNIIAISHYRRKRRWYDDAIVNYMALSGFHNEDMLQKFLMDKI